MHFSTEFSTLEKLLCLNKAYVNGTTESRVYASLWRVGVSRVEYKFPKILQQSATKESVAKSMRFFSFHLHLCLYSGTTRYIGNRLPCLLSCYLQSGSIMNASWPIAGNVDLPLLKSADYLADRAHDFRVRIKAMMNPKGKKVITCWVEVYEMEIAMLVSYEKNKCDCFLVLKAFVFFHFQAEKINCPD